MSAAQLQNRDFKPGTKRNSITQELKCLEREKREKNVGILNMTVMERRGFSFSQALFTY